MKIKYLTALVASSILTVGAVSLPVAFSPVQAAPCAAAPCASPCAANPCAADPCASPCAANPCASPCAAKPCASPCAANPCAANPCAADPCAANPCAANPCAANPCAANPCAANPCAANPCAANPCAANPCAANPCAANPCAANPCAADPCAADPCAAAAAVVTPYEPPHQDIYIEKASQVAIRGADPVAYFTESKAVPGSPDHRLVWNGAVWYFSSEANKKAFKADPMAFAPQYGGYCAKALSEGNLASVDPRAWKIVDGKLYLNYSAEVQAQWVEDIPGNIQKADEFWPNVLSQQTFWENQLAWAQ